MTSPSPATLIVELIGTQSQLKVELDELKTKLSHLESKHRITMAANKILNSQVGVFSELATQYRRKNNELFKTNSTLRKENLTYACLLTTEQDENTKLRQENATLQAQLADLRRENANLRQKNCLLEANKIIQSGIIDELKKLEEHFETPDLGKPIDCSFDEPCVMESVPLPGCMQAFY